MIKLNKRKMGALAVSLLAGLLFVALLGETFDFGKNQYLLAFGWMVIGIIATSIGDER